MGTIKREPAIRAFSLMMVLTMLISIRNLHRYHG